MDRSGTTDCTESGHERHERPEPASSRALVPTETVGPSPRVRGGRPLAGFLTQLIVSADPALRPARSERTKAAVALYAQAAAFERT